MSRSRLVPREPNSFSPIDQVVVINDKGLARGGATSLAIACALGLRERGLPVTYMTGEGPLDPALEAAGVDVVVIQGEVVSPAARLRNVFTGLYRPSAAGVVAHWIAANDTPGTVYHLHNWAHFLSPAALGALKIVHRRLVVTAHDHFLTCGNGAQFSFRENHACTRRANSAACIVHRCDRRNHADKLWRVARHHLRQRVFDFAALDPRVVLIHPGMRESMERGGIPASKQRVIINPVRPYSRTRIAAEDNRDFLYIGRLSHEKGADLAAAAAALAGVGITFIGEGPLTAEVTRLHPEARMLGWCDHAEIAEVAQRARAVIMSSRLAEPFGLVTVESLWSGLPVILSSNAALAPALAGAGAGLAVQRTHEAIGQAMQRLAGDDALTRRMSMAAFTGTRGLALTPEAWVDAHLSLYRERLSVAGAPRA